MISLITCTGGRHEAFALLEVWMSQQTYEGEVEWIVVDDCNPPTWISNAHGAFRDLHTRFATRVLRPSVLWHSGSHQTMTANLLLALEVARGEKILFIEDDELYLPGYLKTMDRLLDTSAIAGQAPARYYHVGHRTFREIGNTHHASLCQTGIREEMRTRTRELARAGRPFLDLELWKGSPGLIDREANEVISIKGMPGRVGIGIGHRVGHARAWSSDSDLSMLGVWAEPWRAALYERFAL